MVHQRHRLQRMAERRLLAGSNLRDCATLYRVSLRASASPVGRGTAYLGASLSWIVLVAASTSALPLLGGVGQQLDRIARSGRSLPLRAGVGQQLDRIARSGRSLHVLERGRSRGGEYRQSDRGESLSLRAGDGHYDQWRGSHHNMRMPVHQQEPLPQYHERDERRMRGGDVSAHLPIWMRLDQCHHHDLRQYWPLDVPKLGRQFLPDLERRQRVVRTGVLQLQSVLLDFIHAQ